MTPSGWICPRRIGFLFPHACERPSPVGCPDCNGGALNDPYAQRDRYGYNDYDDYSTTGSDFTEADGATLVRKRRAYEDKFDAS